MKWKQKIKTAVWAALGMGCVALLFAATKKKDSLTCQKINIQLDDETKNSFVNKEGILAALKQEGIYQGISINKLNLKVAEAGLNKNPWIKDAEIFVNNKQELTVKIEERIPVARLFTVDGASYYIDSFGLRLPSNNAATRVVVFTSFPSSKKILSNPDSLVLGDVKNIANFITADSFWNAQISQINITSQRTYEMIPVIGNQLIILGTADSLQKKFDKLFTFYKNVWSKIGFEKYSKLDISFDNQIVAIRKGELLPKSDTGSAIVQMMNADKKMTKILNDTTYAAPIKNNSDNNSKPVVEKKTNKESDKTKSKKDVNEKSNSTTKKSSGIKTNSKTNTQKNNTTLKVQTNTSEKKSSKPKAVMKKPPS